MSALKRVLAVSGGVAVFVLFVFLSGPAVTGLSHVLFKTTAFPNGQPPARFMVALRDTSKPPAAAALSPVSWRHLSTLKSPDRKFTFLLPGEKGTIPTEADFYAYEVIENRKTSQVVEVHFVNTHTSWSRYEAFEDRIVPISYRTDGGLLMLVPFLVMLVAGLVTGRRVTRLLRGKLAVE